MSIEGIWSAVGPLVGVMIGSFLATKNEHKHWMMDNKKSEYRELVSAMTRAITMAVNTRAGQIGPSEDRKLAAEAEANALALIHDRIFIAKDVAKLRVIPRWHQIMGKIVNGLDAETEFDALKKDLVDNALSLFERAEFPLDSVEE